MSKDVTFFIEEDCCNQRIDKLIPILDESITRSYAQKLLSSGLVSVNASVCTKNSLQLKPGDRLVLSIPEPEPLLITPVDIPLDIVYEDEALLIVNKPKGMVVHPACGHTEDTLVNALMFHCKDRLSCINGVERPGIVHRIDRDTTGLLVVCKTDEAHLSISKQLSTHSITRRYFAIVNGRVKEDGTIDAAIGRHPVERKKMAVVDKNGRRAVTHYHVLETLANGKFSFIECQLETGRTHQIRVHMAHIHHPLLGDTVYGSEKQPYPTQGQVLHASVLGFVHPVTGEYMEFEAPLPEYFLSLLEKLRAQNR